MPRAPGTTALAQPQVSEWDLLMAAASMHEQGRLVEKLPEEVGEVVPESEENE